MNKRQLIEEAAKQITAMPVSWDTVQRNRLANLSTRDLRGIVNERAFTSDAIRIQMFAQEELAKR